MLDQKEIEILGDIFKDYDYVMTTAQLSSVKLYYRDIQRMLNEGLIEKIKRGYYHWIESYGKDEIVIINRLFPDGVLCMDTALFYYKYSDRNPAEWHITIDKNTSRQRTQIEYPLIKAYRVESELLPLGETEGKIDSQKVRIYDRDRTICDVMRNMNKMDKEIFSTAIQGYVKDPKKNISNLMQYAKALRVQKRVKDIIEVWL
ncbi:type IV toxin-antitoxin system AbiEi family antitoxin domain-containing protein [Anaerostipes sp.]|uniref:type IV toxin-antitoxin system AbiEi family antitoxin domain-containing protein n=1 Tax=Anaerostipes sp. TaxID=1872530 RepID=UPI0025802014|nr:type IV toxin-antitoxin system AbiEi family antitoxin domain-containing protein [Anaerostipes sp.]MBS6279119.1 type IV toxin-antitoxin system AbiEi family antitoxin domain-containing protein [Anaerostipes sp.]